MRLHDVCFLSAATAAVLGSAFGLWMGLAGDFAAAPGHAHFNLLAWVTMTLQGLYYRGSGAADWRLARVQVGLALFGFWTFPIALGAQLLRGTDGANPFVIAGASAALAAMILFSAVVALEVRDRRGARSGAFGADSG
jgi:hypothetical protein